MSLLSTKLAQFTVPQELEAMGVYPFFRPISSDQDTVVEILGKRVIMFGSNSYLGLTNHPKVKEAAIEATHKYGTGCAGSPFLNGTIDLHKTLEGRLAEFVGKEEAIVYSTGFGVNLGTISCMTSREDYVILDEFDHASIIEGRRLSYSNALRYKHNDMASLEAILKKCDPDKVKLIVTDGLFSMEGDVAPIKEITTLAKKYNADIFVDEAHSLGVFGRNGSGLVSEAGATDDVALIMGTFSKSFASLGGFIATNKDIANFLRHNSRSYIFSASLTPASSASALAALDIMQSEPERIERLWDNTHYAIDLFRSIGCEIGHTCSPIIPLYVRDNIKTFKITRELFDLGVFVNPVISPAVPSENTLIRLAIMATHTREQIDFAGEQINKLFKKHGIL